MNILEELAVDGGDPVPITLLGVDADVRRRFTGDEAAMVHQLALTNEFEQMLSLITDDGPGLWAKISPLSPEHAAKAMNRIVNLSGLHEGELLAPAPWLASPTRTAGAPPSPASGTTTE